MNRRFFLVGFAAVFGFGVPAEAAETLGEDDVRQAVEIIRNLYAEAGLVQNMEPTGLDKAKQLFALEPYMASALWRIVSKTPLEEDLLGMQDTAAVVENVVPAPGYPIIRNRVIVRAHIGGQQGTTLRQFSLDRREADTPLRITDIESADWSLRGLLIKLNSQ